MQEITQIYLFHTSDCWCFSQSFYFRLGPELAVLHPRHLYSIGAINCTGNIVFAERQDYLCKHHFLLGIIWTGHPEVFFFPPPNTPRNRPCCISKVTISLGSTTPSSWASENYAWDALKELALRAEAAGFEWCYFIESCDSQEASLKSTVVWRKEQLDQWSK